MKVITLWQPWASLIAIGAKNYETRSWPTSYRGPIAIHASKRAFKPMDFALFDPKFATILINIVNDAGLSLDGLPSGCIIATAELVNCWYIVNHPGTNIDKAKDIPIGAESMSIDKHAPDFGDYFVPTEQEMLFGDWSPGRYAWELRNIKMLSEPIPAKGRQRIWDYDISIIEGGTNEVHRL